MTIETIITLIIGAAPALISIIGIITACVKLKHAHKISNQQVIDRFEETRKAVMDTKEFEQLKLELKQAHQENRELKHLVRELLTKIDRIARKEEE